jgi:hypothetical protein
MSLELIIKAKRVMLIWQSRVKCFKSDTNVARIAGLGPYSHVVNNAERRLLLIAIPVACIQVMYDVMLRQVWSIVFKLETVWSYFQSDRQRVVKGLFLRSENC